MINQATVALGGRATTTRRGGLNVLVVEDDEADAHLILRALQGRPKIGQVDLAGDGVEALELLDQQLVAPDLAIIDLHMPRMDGFRLLIELACRQDRDFPIVVLTSSAAKSDIVRSLFRGANRVISKPDTLEELELELAATIAAV
jgi:CheY-like chemotaxis protein